MKTDNPISPVFFKVLSLLIIYYVSVYKIFAQPKIVANIPNGEHSPIISGSNNLVTVHRDFDNDVNLLTETNLVEGSQISYIIPREIDVFECHFSSKGLFFFRGRNNSNTVLTDTILFYDYSTKKVERLGVINFRNGPNDLESRYKVLGVFNNQFYFLGTNQTRDFSIWRSDGTLDGTKRIATLSTPFVQWGYTEGFFVFSSRNLVQNSLMSVSDTGSTIINLLTRDANRYRLTFANYNFGDGNIFINIFDTLTKDYECISTKGTLATTQSRFRHPNVDYITNGLITKKLIRQTLDTLFVRSIETGQIVRKVPLPSELRAINGGRVSPVENGIFTTISNQFGIELAFLNQLDSFVSIDINDGPFSSLNQFDLYFGNNNYIIFNQEAKADSFYLFGLLPRSNRNCLYQVVLHNDSATVIRLANLDYLNNNRIELEKPFVYKSKIYHMIYDIDTRVNTLYQLNPDTNTGAVKEEALDSSLTWHRQIGFGVAVSRDPQFVISDVAIDSEDNSVLSINVLNIEAIANSWNGQSYVLRPFQQYDTKYVKNINTLNITTKIGPTGNVLWTSSFGNQAIRVNNKLHQAIDNNNNIYVVGSAFRTAIFGIDTIRRQNAFLYLVKLDGNTGNILFYKILAESMFTNELDVDVIKVDPDNNLYISFHYENFELPFANSIISNSSVSPANALAKFNESGSLLWLKNTLTPFTRYFGQTRDMCFDSKSGKCYLIQSVGDYNWSSSCKYSNWDSYLQCLNLDGDVLWSKQIISDDLHSLRSIVLDENGNINLSGYFRGTIEFDNFKLTSKRIPNGCNQFQYVTGNISPNTKETFMAMTFDDWIYLPQKNIRDGIVDVNFSIGFEPVSSRSYSLVLKEIDHWGGIVGFNKIEKLGTPFDWDYYPSIATRNNYVVVSDISYNQFDTFSNIMNNVYNISIARYELENLFEQSSYEFPIDEQKSEGDKYNLIVYPNPCINKLHIYNKTEDNVLDYSIYQIDGKQIIAPKFETINNISILDATHLETGFYFLKVVGSNGAETYKFFKE